jgi:c(7)-type cytochrome triheme protein
VPPPPPPTPTPAETVQAALGNGTGTETWDDVERLLPKDQAGNLDWVAAIEQKIIAPRSGIEPGAEAQSVITLDVELVPDSDPGFKVVFSHDRHGTWLACSNCHPAPFEMKAGATPMTAEKVHGDEYCGACHGKVAFGMASGCAGCHLRALPKDSNGRVNWTLALAQKLIAPQPLGDDQPVLDRDVEMKSAKQDIFDAVFPHAAHTQWLSCANCHPRLFPMDGSGLEGADLHSREYCGACHGTVSFGLSGGCVRCHPALEESKHHQASIDLDVELAPKPPSSATVFSHKLHTPWVECSSCHTGLYAANPATAEIPMKEIYTGKTCAGCHGKVATDLTARCRHCHAAEDDG